MFKILISDKLAPEGVNILSEVKDFQVDCKYGISPEELKGIIKDYDALIIRSGTTVTADILEAANRLKVIGRAGVGLDNVDLKAATKKGVVAMNTPAGNTTSTAEHTMSMILALSRNIPQACASLKSGKWERTKFGGVELYGKTLGVVGFGRIGSTVAKMAKGFGMRILTYDPYLSAEVAQNVGAEVLTLEELLKRADYITIHIPKSAETKNIISDKEFGLMKKTVRVINCARGGIVDEKALIKALEEKRIAGCALDVFESEPPAADHPLLKFDNCIATPHLGASTTEAQVNVAIEIAENVRNALLGKGIVNAANFPSISAEAYQVLAPYIDLGERVGRFAGQLLNGRVKEIRVTYNGLITTQKAGPVTMALVFGVLHPILEDSVNMINAVDVARERGIIVQEILSSQEGEFVNLISLEIVTDRDPLTVWGTLSGNRQPRIVKVNKVYVEAFPGGYMLFINNNDKPGVVGAVGTILAKAGINIAGITFGRESSGGMAVSVVNVDGPISDEIIRQMQTTPDILFAKLIKV